MTEARHILCLLLVVLLSTLAFARGGGGCFLSGTLISTPDGGRLIEDIASGDEVISFDGDERTVSHVIAVYSVNASRFYEIKTATSSVNVTGEHLFYLGGGVFKEAKDVKAGDVIATLTGSEIVVSVDVHDSIAVAYNLLVGGSNLFAANSMIVHNKGCFLPDTQVLAADGSTMEISSIKEGDVVVGFTYEGAVVNATVAEIYTATAEGYFVIRAGDYEARATREHPFYVGEGLFRITESLGLGDVIYVYDGTGLRQESVSLKEWVAGETTVYNLKTDWPNTYFANFIAVHNKGGGGCFAAGTKVLAAYGEVDIEKINVGDKVFSAAPENGLRIVRVRGIFKGVSQLLRIQTSKGIVDTTSEHPFMTKRGGFKNAGELSIGDDIVVFDGKRFGLDRIMSVQSVGYANVYNLQVGAPYTFVANGFVVHNKGGSSGGSSSSSPYTSAKYCFGGYELLRLSDGRVVNGSECIYVYYLKIKSADASILSRCVSNSAGKVWDACWNQSSFAITRELRFRCALAEGCPEGSHYTADGMVVKVEKPPGLLERVLPYAIFGFFVAIWFVLMFGRFFGLFPGGRASKSNQNLDYCYPSKKVDAKSEKTAKVLEYLKGIDGQWEAELLKATAKEAFLRMQECWEKREYTLMQPLLMPSLYRQHLGQIESLRRNHEINKLEGVEVLRVEIVHLRHHAKKERQEYTALIEAKIRDYYVDDRSNKFLRGDSGKERFQEFWVFQRQGDKWLLREINQTRESDALRAENFVEDVTPEQLKNIYGALATPVREKAPWLEEAIGTKSEKIHRMLNFLATTDKTWDEEAMKETVRKAFIGVLTALEKRDLADVKPMLMTETFEHYSSQIDGMKREQKTVEFRNMCARKVDIILVRNFSDGNRDEFTVRVCAHAQKIEKKGDKTLRQDEYVTPFEEYWTFQKQAGEWKMRERQPPARTKSIIEEENLDEESSKEQMQWYYTKDRAL